jgi:hypothetical protein
LPLDDNEGDPVKLKLVVGADDYNVQYCKVEI